MAEAQVLTLLIPKPTTGYNPNPNSSRGQHYLILRGPMEHEPAHPLSPNARNNHFPKP
jgi:hypothetical protein